MALTFLESQTAVGALINQEVTDDSRTVTLTSVKRNLNIGYQMALNALTAIDPTWLGDIVTANLVADQDVYQLPTSCKKLTRLEIGYTASTSRYPALLRRVQEPSTTVEIFTPSTTNPEYEEFGQYIIIRPIPTVAVTKGLRFFYIKGATDLSDPSDTYNLPSGYEHLPIMYATARAKETMGLSSESKADLNDFYSQLGIMKSEAFNRLSNAGNKMVKTTDL